MHFQLLRKYGKRYIKEKRHRRRYCTEVYYRQMVVKLTNSRAEPCSGVSVNYALKARRSVS
jgi:hypothetical protein